MCKRQEMSRRYCNVKPSPSVGIPHILYLCYHMYTIVNVPRWLQQALQPPPTRCLCRLILHLVDVSANAHPTFTLLRVWLFKCLFYGLCSHCWVMKLSRNTLILIDIIWRCRNNSCEYNSSLVHIYIFLLCTSLEPLLMVSGCLFLYLFTSVSHF